MGNGSSTNAKTGSSLPHLATKDIHFYVIEYESELYEASAGAGSQKGDFLSRESRGPKRVQAH